MVHNIGGEDLVGQKLVLSSRLWLPYSYFMLINSLFLNISVNVLRVQSLSWQQQVPVRPPWLTSMLCSPPAQWRLVTARRASGWAKTPSRTSTAAACPCSPVRTQWWRMSTCTRVSCLTLTCDLTCTVWPWPVTSHVLYDPDLWPHMYCLTLTFDLTCTVWPVTSRVVLFLCSLDGFLYEKQAILEYILHQKTEIAKRMKVNVPSVLSTVSPPFLFFFSSFSFFFSYFFLSSSSSHPSPSSFPTSSYRLLLFLLLRLFLLLILFLHLFFLLLLQLKAPPPHGASRGNRADLYVDHLKHLLVKCVFSHN